MNKMFAVSGSQGCGKTTVLNDLKQQGYVVTERKTSRSIQKEWGYTLEQINADPSLTVKFQWEILQRKIEDEVGTLADFKWEGKNDPIFTERTFADLFTYCLVVLGKEPSMNEFLDKYYEECSAAQTYYDKVFYMTAGHFDVERDVHRASNNQHYCRMIDLVMLDITKRMTPPEKLIIINTSNHEERIRIIQQEIQ